MRTLIARLTLGALPLLSAVLHAQVSLHEAYADLPGARIFYIDTGGSGIPLVLLHAATGSTRSWEYQIPAFTAAGYRVIAFDRRGWGRTIVDPEGPQPGTAADDLLGLLDHLAIQRAHLVGSGGGAFVVLDFALSFPKRVRSIVIANSIGGVQDPDFLEIGRRLRPPQFGSLSPDFQELSPSYRAVNPDGTKRWNDIEKSSRAEGARTNGQPMRNRPTYQQLESIDLPALLLTGDADLIAPPPVLRLLAARIKKSESLIVPEAGHSTFWEQPDVFNRAVLGFVGKH